MIKGAPKKVTIKDIAQHVGVASSTVSRVLNKASFTYPVSEKTVDKIFATVDELGYRPSFAGKMLKSGKTNIISVIVPQLTNPFYAKFISIIKERALLKSYDVVIYDFSFKPELERGYLDKMLTRCCDGVITSLTSFKHTGDIFNKLRRARVPCVIFGPPPNSSGIKYDAISEGTPNAIRHLFDYGHKNILIATGFLAKDVLKTRIESYQAEFKKYGLEFVPERNLIPSFTTSGCQADDGWLCGRKIFSKPSNVTAIACINDYFAIGLMRAALDAGLKIPEDISIIGSDNIWAGKYSPIPLTTVDQNLEQVAEKALNIIFERIKSKNWDEPKHYTVQSRLIIRESTRELTT